MQEADGGPQSCIGLIVEACQTAGGEEEACTAREGNAWLAATNLDAATAAKIGEKNAGVYRATQSKIISSPQSTANQTTLP